MALTKVTVVSAVQVEADGQLTVFKADQFWEGGVGNGTLEATGRRYSNSYDVGDVIPASEDILVKDVVNGNLHNAERKTKRDEAKGQGGG